jgi:hypothetical protein
MAAIESPRRILGDRDVNKPLLPKQLSATSPSGKLISVSPNNAVHEKSLEMGKLAQILLSPKMQDVSSVSVTSPSGGRKRGAACLEEAQDGPPRKQAVVGLPTDGHDGAQSREIDHESRPARGEETASRGVAVSTSIHMRKAIY